MNNLSNIHLIGNAHIDPVWLWTWQEGLAEVRATFRSAVERLREYSGFIFTASSAAYYDFIERTEPELFEEIKKFAEEGRWQIVGGWWVQPDCNIPSGESFCRQSLIGQRYFLSRFGCCATVGYNVDSFGHNGQLPQILKQSGMSYYVFSRPAHFEKKLPEAFQWQSADGSSVIAHRIAFGYETNTMPDLKEKLEKFCQLPKDEPHMLFYGVGNHGGGPTSDMIKHLGSLGNAVRFSSPQTYFSEISKTKLSVVKDDLQRHAVGCYSAHGAIKSGNFHAENTLAAAEAFSVMAQKACGADYPAERLIGLWKNLLFHQFHDILGGCSIKDACIDTVNAQSKIIYDAGELSGIAAQKICAQINTAQNLLPMQAAESLGRPFVVFSPLARAARVSVRVRRLFISQNQTEFKSYAAFDLEGNTFAVQPIESGQTIWHSLDGLFSAIVPPYGYKLFYIKETDAPVVSEVSAWETSECIPARSFNTVYGRCVLENAHIRAEFDCLSGKLVRLLDKGINRECLSAPCRAVVLDDFENDTWAHDVSETAHLRNQALGVWSSCIETMDKAIGEFSGSGAVVIENGPVRATVRTVSAYGKSTLIQDFSLTAGSGRLEVSARINMQEAHLAVRLVFPFALEKPGCVAEIPYGFVSQESDGKEFCARRYVLMRDASNGVAVITQGKHSFSTRDSTLGFIAARTALYADHGGVRDTRSPHDFLDKGEQQFSYALLPCAPDAISECEFASSEFSASFETVAEGYHNGSLPPAQSFIATSLPHVTATAIKQAEDGEGTVVRLVETGGLGGECEISFFDMKTSVSFRPHEIKTVCFESSGNIYQTDLLEQRRQEDI